MKRVSTAPHDTPGGITAAITKLTGAITAEAASNSKPWYRQSASIFAGIALLVSLGSLAASIVYNTMQNQTMDRQQLVTLVEDLAQIPATRAQIANSNKSLSVQLKLSGDETIQEDIEADEAARLVRGLNWNVPAAELYQVGLAYSDASLPTLALHYLQAGIRIGSDEQTESGMYRAEAGVLYGLGRRLAAATAISKAYSEVTLSGGFPASSVDQNRIFTDLYAAERVWTADCSGTEGYLRDATALLGRLSPGSSSFNTDEQRLTNDAVVNRLCTDGHSADHTSSSKRG